MNKQGSLKMKTKWNGELRRGLEELSSNEKTSIVGGDTLWYWVIWGLTQAEYILSHTNPQQSSGQQLMNAALG
jgi:hypothetical protein